MKERLWLKELRGKEGWTGSETARRLCCSMSGYWNWESGERELMTVHDIIDIAYVFKLTPEAVFKMEKEYLNGKSKAPVERGRR